MQYKLIAKRVIRTPFLITHDIYKSHQRDGPPIKKKCTESISVRFFMPKFILIVGMCFLLYEIILLINIFDIAKGALFNEKDK